ncbi:hypothetical protein DV113_004066 [Geotrichum candidum]|nr:hypothetical protein DV113_004066 [Geotrichum candidum]KAI8132876.1 hypothetical protein DUD61_003467 [Geotrichum candidum]
MGTPAQLPQDGVATRRVLVKRGQAGADIASNAIAGDNANGSANSREESAEHETYIKQEEDDYDYHAEGFSHNPVSSSFQFSPSPPPLPAPEQQSMENAKKEAKPEPFGRRALLQTARKLTLSDLESSGDDDGVGTPPKLAVHLEPGEGVSFHNSSGMSGEAEEDERIETPPELSVFDKQTILGDEQETGSGEAEPEEPAEHQKPRPLDAPAEPVVVEHEDEDSEPRPRAVRLVYEDQFTQEELDRSILSGPKRVIRESSLPPIDDIHEDDEQENEYIEQGRGSHSPSQYNDYDQQDDREEAVESGSILTKPTSPELLPGQQEQFEFSPESEQEEEDSDEDEPLIRPRKETTPMVAETTNNTKDYSDNEDERRAREQRREKLRQERLERERERKAEQERLEAATAADEEFDRARRDLAERLARERETRIRLQREETERAQRRRETEALEQARLEAEQARIMAEKETAGKRRAEEQARERERDARRKREAEELRAKEERLRLDREDEQRSRWEQDENELAEIEKNQQLNRDEEDRIQQELHEQAEREAQERARQDEAAREQAEREARERRFQKSKQQSAALLESQLQRESQLRAESESSEADRPSFRQQQQRKRARPSLTRTPLPRGGITPKKTFSPLSPSQRLLQRRAIYPRIGRTGVGSSSRVPAPAQPESHSLSTPSTFSGASLEQRSPRSSFNSTTLSTSTQARPRNGTIYSTGSTDRDEEKMPEAKRARLVLTWTTTHWRRLYHICVQELHLTPAEMAAAAAAADKARDAGHGGDIDLPLALRSAFPEFDSRELSFRLLALARTLAKNGPPSARDLNPLDRQELQPRRARSLRDSEHRSIYSR